MSKKKSRNKKISKKKRIIQSPKATAASGQSQVVASQSQPAEAIAAPAVKQPAKLAPTVDAVVTDEWAYVRTDMRQIIILAIGCIGVELLLWWALTNTALGPNIYNLIQL